MSQTKTTVSTSVELPQASLHSSTGGDRTQANIELAELGRTESIKSIKISTGPSTSPSERTKSELWTARIQFATLCWTLFLAGWNDGTTGPLLPRIQEVYHVTLSSLIFDVPRTNNIPQANFAIVSLIFVFNTIVSVYDYSP